MLLLCGAVTGKTTCADALLGFRCGGGQQSAVSIVAKRERRHPGFLWFVFRRAGTEAQENNIHIPKQI